MISRKNLYLANFNCTFGEKNYPMLKYFEEIIYPAFTSGIVRKPSYKNEYFFNKVELIEYSIGKFAIVGMIVKKTILERKSLIDEDGSIDYRDDKIPSHPFSYFIIFLNNHRMVLVKNQSGSPDVKNFESMARFAISERISDLNISQNDKVFEKGSVNVTDIPCNDTVKDKISSLSKINNITLTFYPLNGGDVPTEGFYNMYREILESSGSEEGTMAIKNPRVESEEDKQFISNMITQEGGMVKHTIKGKNLNGEPVKIKDNDMSEVISIELNDGEHINNNINRIVEVSNTREEITNIGDENARIYDMNLDKIKCFFRKLRTR